MKILITADAVGGVWTYALDLARGLSARGVAVTIALSGPSPDEQGRAEAARAGATLVETGLQLDWLADASGDVTTAGDAIARLAERLRIDVVHLNSPALAADVRFPCPVVGVCHSCVATWWEAVRGGPLPADFRWRTDLVARGYRACDVLAAPSMSFATATTRTYGLGEPPSVVHNGRAPPPPAGLDTASPHSVAFTAGRLWDEGKNIATLERAAARIVGPVVAAGPLAGPNGTSVTLRHVRALGRLSGTAIAQRLAGRPIFVSPALYEPFGLAVLEAAQHGCALVLSDTPTFRELWDGAATFVAATDDKAWADAIETLARDADLRTARGEAARRRAVRYGCDRMADGVMALYAMALDQAPAPAFRAAS